jgi:hypothetical protein
MTRFVIFNKVYFTHASGIRVVEKLFALGAMQCA